MDNLKALNIDATSFEHARSGGEHAASGRSRPLACVRLRTPRSSFITDPSCWLGHSTFFAALFAGKSGSAMDDGSFFIDCDSDLFTHVLQYLRTAVLPIFYDTTRGHDFAQYHALLGEAEYFGIDRLSKWLRSKRYLDAVHIHYVGDTSSDLVTYAPSDVNGRPFTHTDCQFLEVPTDEHKNIQLMPITPQPYVPHHPVDGKSAPDDCSCCSDSAVNGDPKRPNDSMWSVVRREVVFDHDLCVNAFTEDLDHAITTISTLTLPRI